MDMAAVEFEDCNTTSGESILSYEVYKHLQRIEENVVADVYGIRLREQHLGEGEKIFEYPNISDELEQVELLCASMKEGSVDSTTAMDIILDWVNR